jgi:universal stress protein E
MPNTRILVVYDPTTEAQPALARAAALAESAADSDVELHVYSCIYSDPRKSEGQSGGKEELIAAQEEIVKNAVSSLGEKGVDVAIEIEWDKDWYQAVVRAADRIKADAVFKSSHKHSATQRLLKPTSDRTLLRQCACPVLLVKRDAEVVGQNRIILAAVQFRGEDGAYEKLNQKILDFCHRSLATDAAKVHFINAYTDLSNRPDKGQLVRACGVPGDQVHVKMGETDDIIVDFARELDASMVVIGNSSRTGLSALINTNTAEKILDKLDCDLLAMP